MVHMLFTMYTVMSFFDAIGMLIFRSAITIPKMVTVSDDAPFLYYLENFNDFYDGLIVLFILLVENNWNNTTDMYTDIFGNWARVFFCTNWVIMVLIIFNIVAASILELYASTSANLESRYAKRKFAKKLMNAFKDKDELQKFVKKVQGRGEEDRKDSPC